MTTVENDLRYLLDRSKYCDGQIEKWTYSDHDYASRYLKGYRRDKADILAAMKNIVDYYLPPVKP